MSEDITGSLHTTTYDDGRFIRTAIIADDGASFVIVAKDGKTPLALVNAFDFDNQRGTIDVIPPRGVPVRVQLLSVMREVLHGRKNGREWLRHGEPHVGNVIDTSSPWGSPLAVITEGPAQQ